MGRMLACEIMKGAPPGQELNLRPSTGRRSIRISYLFRKLVESEKGFCSEWANRIERGKSH
jgi:hypothetical protein